MLELRYMQTRVNRKRCGDGDELSYVGYARVNSSVFSLALKVPRVLAVLVFTVSWFQTVGAATEKARDKTVQYTVQHKPHYFNTANPNVLIK